MPPALKSVTPMPFFEVSWGRQRYIDPLNLPLISESNVIYTHKRKERVLAIRHF